MIGVIWVRAVDQHQRVRVGLARRAHVADAGRAAAAGLVHQRHRHRHQLLLGDDLVDHARHQVGAAADRERDHELDVLGRLPALGETPAERQVREQQQANEKAHRLLLEKSVVVEANYTRGHGDAGRGRLARRSARYEVDRRRVRPAGKRVPRPGAASAEPGRYRLYVAKSCPWAHRTLVVRALKGLEKAIPVFYAGPDMLENGWEFDDGGIRYLHRAVCQGEAGLHRPRHRAGALGRERNAHRQQRVVRDHPHAQPRFRRARAAQARRPLPRKTQKGNRLAQRTHLPHGEQRRLPRGIRHRPGQVRGGGDASCSRRSTGWRSAWRSAKWLCGKRFTEADVRLFTTLVRFDAVYYSHFKCNLRRLVDYPEPVALDAARVRAAGRGEDRRHEADQGALLPQHEADQSHADRAQRAVAGLFACISLSSPRRRSPPAIRWTA